MDANRSFLVTYLRPLRARVLLLATLLFVGIGLQLLSPQVVRIFLDATQSGGPSQLLIITSIAFLVVGVAERVAALATSYVGLDVGWAATNSLRSDLVQHCLQLDMPFHKTHTPGELIERIDGDSTMLANFLSQLAIRIAGNAILVAGILVLLYREDVRAGLTLTAFVALTVAVLLAIQNLGAARWAAARAVWSDFSGFLEERIGGTEDLRGVGAEAYTIGQLDSLMQSLLRIARRGWMATALSFVSTNFLYVVAYGLGLALGAYLYTYDGATIGTAFVIVYYIGMLAAPLDVIRVQSDDLQQARAAIGRIQALFAVGPEIPDTAQDGRLGSGKLVASFGLTEETSFSVGEETLPETALSVEFAGVSFAYRDGAPSRTPVTSFPARPGCAERAGVGEETPSGQTAWDLRQEEVERGDDYVLRAVSFHLAPGRVLGVLGRTGSGKTTLARLLFRLYEPDAGVIALGGVDIRKVGIPELRARVGLVTQDVQLFGASLRDNITFFDDAVGDDQVTRALGELGLLDWVLSMPNGMDTKLAAGGQALSAGEAQLLAFTRLYLKNPGLLVLDEATSRLDPITQWRVERAVDRLSQGRSAIIIAHRLRTVMRADEVLILEGGRVVEYGPREELVADPHSRFSALLKAGLQETLA